MVKTVPDLAKYVNDEDVAYVRSKYDAFVSSCLSSTPSEAKIDEESLVKAISDWEIWKFEQLQDEDQNRQGIVFRRYFCSKHTHTLSLGSTVFS